MLPDLTVSFGEWAKNLHVEAKTSVSLQYYGKLLQYVPFCSCIKNLNIVGKKIGHSIHDSKFRFF